MPENIKYTGAPTLTPEEARRTAAIEPYRLDFPQVRLSRAGEEAGQEIGRATGVLGATMHTVGASIDSLGKTFDNAGTELWNRAMGIKQLESETKVNNATVAWELGQVKRDEEFKGKAGEAANSQALEAQLKTNEEGRQKVRNTLTPYEQKMFDAQTTRQLIISARNSGAHAAQETKTLAGHAIEARVGLLGNGVASAKEDVDAKAKLQEMARIYDTEWRHIHGANDDMVHREYMIAATKAIAARAERVATDGDPTHAMKILEDNKKDLDDVDSEIYRRVSQHVKAEDSRIATRVLSDKAYHDDPDASLGSIEDKAKKLAEEHRPGDKVFSDNTITQVRATYGIERQKQLDNENRAEDLLSSAAHGLTPGQQGKTPQRWEEVEAVPGVKEAIGTLKRKDEFINRMHKIVLDNAFGDRWADTPEAEARGRQLKGMYINGNPEFANVKLEDEKLPRKGTWGKDTLLLNQMKMIHDGLNFQKDPHVDKAFKAINSALVLPKNLNKKGPEQDLFMSALWHAIQSEQQIRKDKPLSSTDYVEMGKQLLQTGEWSWFGGAPPAYRAAATPTSAYSKDFKKDHPLASPQDIQFEWAKDHVRTLLKKEESRSAPKGPTITTVPTKVVTPP
jgi:hypothetical protein